MHEPEGSVNGSPREALPHQVPHPSPTQTTPSADRVHSLFLGPEGLRPGWSLFLYFGMGTVVFLLLSGFVRFIPSRGAGALWQTLFTYIVLVISSLVPARVMGAIEKRPFADFGLAWRGVLSKHFWLGLLWGIVALSVFGHDHPLIREIDDVERWASRE